jgi:hypothetical protein
VNLVTVLSIVAIGYVSIINELLFCKNKFLKREFSLITGTNKSIKTTAKINKQTTNTT